MEKLADYEIERLGELVRAGQKGYHGPRLNLGQRLMLVRMYLEGRSYYEVAKASGVSAATVRYHVLRALDSAKDKL